ncbi:NusG domain II-containing protein [Clostridium transplantifaecale]|uniref:NusG domain II-containing protein n=1 Tax=Clostridium transplantifaecale TaxID=2479838 RepID=UPI000F63B8EB|nr:NusG domain II-containing protein [Clostridium transplantifaecale]
MKDDGLKDSSLNSDSRKKKNEIFLICGLLAAALIFFTGYRFLNRGEASVVVVSVNGKTIREFPLGQDADFMIEGVDGGTNHMIIKNGAVSVFEASCPDKICVQEGEKRQKGEAITCLPNKVIVTIK